MSGTHSPGGVNVLKCTSLSLGGEKLRSASVESSIGCLNSTTSDELINYTDTLVKEISELVPKVHIGITSPALYDRHPTK